MFNKFKMGLGLWRFYQAPRDFITLCQRNGFQNEIQSRAARLRMERAAVNLRVEGSEQPPTLPEIHFLTGKKFWYQTSFCAYSMIKSGQTNLRPVIYDDGTLYQPYVEKLLNTFPQAKIVSALEIKERLDSFLPADKFPHLRHQRIHYPHLRKLTDIRAGATEWQLVLDSDMLFFQRPTVLLEWLKDPQNPCYMMDVRTAYGYSDQLMNSLANSDLPERVNVGICGLKSGDIDWERLEFCCKTLVESEGLKFHLEQALTALLFSGKNCLATPPEQYLVYPSAQEVTNPQAIMHHYTGESKIYYFQYGWKHIVRKDQ